MRTRVKLPGRQGGSPSPPGLHRSGSAGYVIVTDSYTANSAGISCLYRLCDELNRRGYVSFVTGGKSTAPHLNAPLISADAARALCARGYSAIYPETVAGNPLQARTVVRWVLNRPGLLGGDRVYAASEHIYAYSDVFVPYIDNQVAGKLYMPTIDHSLFYCEDADLAKRSLECYYVGKSTWKDGVVDRSRAFEITRQTPDKKELGKLFRASRALYCFDNSTILIYEALFCGCPVVVIPDGTHTRHDYERLELGLSGIAWGPDEFNSQPVDLDELQARYRTVTQQFARQLEQMIQSTRPTGTSGLEDLAALWKIARNHRWYRVPIEACQSGAKSAIDAGRDVERSLRRLRKRYSHRLKQLISARPTRVDDRLFFCNDRDLSRRNLECFFLGESRWRTGIFERNNVLEIVPSTPLSQLGKVFRASRLFYSFDARTPHVQYALACGCPVVVVGAFGRLKHIVPPGI